MWAITPREKIMRSHQIMLMLAATVVSLVATAQSPTLHNQTYGPDPDQRYDLYRPAGTQRAPIILMVHGGGWSRGDKDVSRVVDNKLTHWLPKAIAFASTNYRMQPKSAPLEQARDVARALSHVQHHAADLGIDRDNVVLMGHSAGAHLIALLAARPELLTDAGARPPLGYVLLDSGALNVPEIMMRRHLPLYDRAFGNNPADWHNASPYQQLRQAPPPILAICAARRASSCSQAREFTAKANHLGGQAETRAVDKSHGEINYQLGEEGEYTARVDRFLSRLSPQFAERLSTSARP
jgi:acetyl esterase/lipase